MRLGWYDLIIGDLQVLLWPTPSEVNVDQKATKSAFASAAVVAKVVVVVVVVGDVVVVEVVVDVERH